MPNISGIIKTLQNIMRKDLGVSGDAQRIEQLGWMITLKILDDKDAEMELLNDDYVSVIPEKLRWRSCAGNSEGITGDAMKEFVDGELFPGLQNLDVYYGNDLSADRHGGVNRRAVLVRDIFAGTNNYMKNGTIIRQVVNKLNEIDFNASEDRHTFGDIYESLLPDGSLTGDGVKQRIREEFLKQCNVHTIVRLPNSVFKPYASVATNLLFFTKGEPTKEIWYWEHKLPEGQKSYSKTRPIQKSEFASLKEWWGNRTENEQAWKVPVERIAESGWNLDIKNPFVKEEEVTHSTAELLDMLSASFKKSDELIEELKKELK